MIGWQQWMMHPMEKVSLRIGVTVKFEKIDYALTICKVTSELDVDLNKAFYFIGKTDEEYSLVCITEDTPVNTIEREDGWKGFRIKGPLDFSMVGILAEISSILAENKIGIFAISTFNTDYILVKEENFERAVEALVLAGYEMV